MHTQVHGTNFLEGGGKGKDELFICLRKVSRYYNYMCQSMKDKQLCIIHSSIIKKKFCNIQDAIQNGPYTLNFQVRPTFQ